MVTTAEGEGEEPGATRTLETSDGLRWAERLTQTDQSQRLYWYEVTGSELPIADFAANSGSVRVGHTGAP